MKSSVQYASNKYLENISRMFKKLYNDEQLTDVTLCCKDGTIKAHKIILATSSPYFHKIFTENHRDHPILVMHGVAYQHLHDLIELIYKGNVDVYPESLSPLYELAGEFQLSGISGVLREEVDKYNNMENGICHGRDTRFRGQKRVAVDYNDSDTKVVEISLAPPKKINEELNESGNIAKKNTDLTQTTTEVKIEVTDNSDDTVTVDDDVIPINNFDVTDPPKLSAWARKQRKFKCDLCPSSFKRSSHLSRHQLVHTGERPFACEQCDKAFSRHDKLKHHIKKTHEQEEYHDDYNKEYDDDYNNDYDLEMSHSLINSPSPPPFVIAHVRSEAIEESNNSPAPPKRPRGRPRKYPPVVKPLIKRGRGRPRLNPVKPPGDGENYDITNLPYGDLNYLTMPLQETPLIEPFVEIQTEKEASTEKTEEEKPNEEVVEDINEDMEVTAANLKDIENRIAKIGECTISVANH